LYKFCCGAAAPPFEEYYIHKTGIYSSGISIIGKPSQIYARRRISAQLLFTRPIKFLLTGIEQIGYNRDDFIGTARYADGGSATARRWIFGQRRRRRIYGNRDLNLNSFMSFCQIYTSWGYMAAPGGRDKRVPESIRN
jgi:hypothetical protein